MTLPVVWRPSARADLIGLYDWIAEQAGGEVAYRYAAGVESVTASLADFPNRGSPRPDLGPGVRTVVHRRRTVIAYRAAELAIEVLALAHGGRDLGGRFAAEED